MCNMSADYQQQKFPQYKFSNGSRPKTNKQTNKNAAEELTAYMRATSSWKHKLPWIPWSLDKSVHVIPILIQPKPLRGVRRHAGECFGHALYFRVG